MSTSAAAVFLSIQPLLRAAPSWRLGPPDKPNVVSDARVLRVQQEGMLGKATLINVVNAITTKGFKQGRGLRKDFREDRTFELGLME